MSDETKAKGKLGIIVSLITAAVTVLLFAGGIKAGWITDARADERMAATVEQMSNSVERIDSSVARQWQVIEQLRGVQAEQHATQQTLAEIVRRHDRSIDRLESRP